MIAHKVFRQCCVSGVVFLPKRNAPISLNLRVTVCLTVAKLGKVEKTSAYEKMRFTEIKTVCLLTVRFAEAKRTKTDPKHVQR